MKRSGKPKIILHGQGTGDLSDADVEKRARELAVIRGRSGDQVNENDRAEAWSELHGDLVPETSDTDGQSAGAMSRDPSEPIGVPGRQIPNREGDDETAAVERLASEGVEEAQHDQMLASRDQEHRQDRR
ncbi:MAG: hypothetical protein JWM88_2111 [Verrucomicrobia bacterium]|nr:hypothetical protein [Verrucomicrobiota bacterium]